MIHEVSSLQVLQENKWGLGTFVDWERDEINEVGSTTEIYRDSIS